MSGPTITTQQLVLAMQDVDKPLHPRYIYRLSDLETQELNEIKRAWPEIPIWRRQAIFEDILEIGQANTILSFEAIARYAVSDPDAHVREQAVRALWEYEERDLVRIFLNLLHNDASPEVRAVSASGLGRFVYLGEIEELPENTLHEIEERLLATTTGSDTLEVRRRALESLGYSGRDEVAALIEKAYSSKNAMWLVSALSAMGRSADHKWNGLVLEMLEYDNPEVCNEAARAAGELELRRAVPLLMELLNTEDSELRMTSVWSLSQIGGPGIQDALEELLEETEDEDEVEFIEEALENLAFTEETQLFDLIDVAEDEAEEVDDDAVDDEEIPYLLDDADEEQD